MAFLEFLIETQRALRESVKALTTTAPADAFAELKRLQNELQQEITPLEEKIQNELTPKQSGPGSPPQGRSSELEQGITLLRGWAKAAGEKMSSAARHLDARRILPPIRNQRTTSLPAKGIRSKTGPSLQRKVYRQPPFNRHSALKAKIWCRSLKCRSERSVGRNC